MVLTGAGVQSWAGPGRAEGRADRAAGGGKSEGTEVLLEKLRLPRLWVPSQKKGGKQGKDLDCGLRSGCGKHLGSGTGRGKYTSQHSLLRVMWESEGSQTLQIFQDWTF